MLEVDGVIEGLEKAFCRLIGGEVSLSIRFGRPGRVKVDPAQLREALMTLVARARDAMPSGGMLSIRTSLVAVGPAANPAQSTGEDGPKTILLVDDEPVVRAVAVRVLESAGYKVLQAKGAEEALELAAERGASMHLVLTDVAMPGMDGLELAARLKPLIPHAKIMIMSAYIDKAISNTSVFPVGARFLQKPFTPKTLADNVRSALAGETA